MRRLAAKWYEGYDERVAEVLELRSSYEKRCAELSALPADVIDEVNRSIIAKSVHESNWQEGIELDQNRTRELAEAARDSCDLDDNTKGPHLDVKTLLAAHRIRALALIRRGCSKDELATFNLARAHLAIWWLTIELVQRRLGRALQLIEQVKEAMEKGPRSSDDPLPALYLEMKRFVSELRASPEPVRIPTTEHVRTEGELVNALLALGTNDMLSPMNVSYVHFLHKLLFCGILDVRRCGVFRRIAVHIPGNPNLEFPPWQAVDGLMKEFCRGFPVPDSMTNAAGIMSAARASHRFVAIHPYADGNGRISRLLMNLVLVGRGFPIVYLKANKKGRHRYVTALRRADRGNHVPLACLISASLSEVYSRLLFAIRDGQSGQNKG